MLTFIPADLRNIFVVWTTLYMNDVWIQSANLVVFRNLDRDAGTNLSRWAEWSRTFWCNYVTLRQGKGSGWVIIIRVFSYIVTTNCGGKHNKYKKCIANRSVKPWPCGCWCLGNSHLRWIFGREPTEMNIWARTNGMLSAVNDLNLNQAPYSRENLGRGTKNGTALCVFTTNMHDCSTELSRGSRGRVVGFTATYAISTYHH